MFSNTEIDAYLLDNPKMVQYFYTDLQVDNYLSDPKKHGKDFVKEYRVSYHGIKQYLRKRHGKGLKEIKHMTASYVIWYVDDVLSKKQPNFYKRFVVKYDTIRDWILRNFGWNMSEIESEELPLLVKEYIEFRDRDKPSSYNSFFVKYGLHRKTFYYWLKENYGLGLSQLNEEERIYYINLCLNREVGKRYKR